MVSDKPDYAVLYHRCFKVQAGDPQLEVNAILWVYLRDLLY